MCGDDERRYYKYMTRGTGRIVLANGSLRWSRPGTFNDPYDNQFDLHIDYDRAAVRQAALDRQWEAYSAEDAPQIGNAVGLALQVLREVAAGRITREEWDRLFGPAIDQGIEQGERGLPVMQHAVRAWLAQNKFLCLSEVANQPLMWAHYAENNSGIVLGFRTVPELDSPWPEGRLVQYVDNMPRLIDTNFLADMMSGRVRMDVETWIQRLVFTKSSHWAYEREWRIWTGVGRDPDVAHEDVPFAPEELDKVIVGLNTPEADRIAFIELAEAYPSARVYEVVRREREFEYDVVPLE